MARWTRVSSVVREVEADDSEPRSSVPQAGVPNSTYYGQPQTGMIGRDLPKEIVRIERDWHLGDICQYV